MSIKKRLKEKKEKSVISKEAQTVLQISKNFHDQQDNQNNIKYKSTLKFICIFVYICLYMHICLYLLVIHLHLWICESRGQTLD